jgi:hypothetical protein
VSGRTKRQILLTEESDVVEFRLVVGGNTFTHREEDARAVRVNVPRPEPDRLVENSKWLASQGACDGTTEGNLAYYIECREAEISEQVLEIRKAALRIERQLECIAIARQVMGGGPGMKPTPSG